MVNTVGIRFPNSGKTYCFNAKDMELTIGERVVVESELGISIGSIAKTTLESNTPEDKIRPVLRKVTAADLKQEEENDGVRIEANAYCKERIKSRELSMKLISTDVTLDRKRFIFYFTADSRIDFRELVKDLASKFRSRIELRQIGVRDAAKMAGGYGVCGKEICCKTWLRTFAPISIKMAKQQDLILNTCKLSGLCGRLLCCLNYEYEEGAVKRKRQKRHVPASAKVQDAALDTALAEAVKSPQKKEPAKSEPEAQASSAQPAKPDSATPADPVEKKPFKKSRRSHRSRAARKAKGTGQDAEKTATAGAGVPAQKPGQSSGDSAEPKPKTRRRKRRRGRKRRPGSPEGSGSAGGPQNKGGPAAPSGPGGSGPSPGTSGPGGSGGTSGPGSTGGPQDSK